MPSEVFVRVTGMKEAGKVKRRREGINIDFNEKPNIRNSLHSKNRDQMMKSMYYSVLKLLDITKTFLYFLYSNVVTKDKSAG